MRDVIKTMIESLQWMSVTWCVSLLLCMSWTSGQGQDSDKGGHVGLGVRLGKDLVEEIVNDGGLGHSRLQVSHLS